jgi:uncharacterized protein
MFKKKLSAEDAPWPYWNPYLSGVLLGLCVLGSFLVLGAGLDASSALGRMAAFVEIGIVPGRAASGDDFAGLGPSPLNHYLVFMFLGIFLGGLYSSIITHRITWVLERGASCSSRLRAILAVGGGVLAGFGARLAQGCVVTEGLTGPALLLSSGLVFLACVFAGGYATAYFAGRQWND